jgi:PAS domain-containing protein
MIDIDEHFRAIYFAPVPLVVLSQTRAIKLINEAAERMLGLSTSRCVGQKLERFMKDSSKAPFTLALNEAIVSRATSSSSKGVNQNSTRLELLSPESIGGSFWADLFISAWFFGDLIPNDPIRRGSSDARVPHEAHYTISLIPSHSATSSHDSDSDSQTSSRQSMASILKEAAFDNLGTGIIALSKDGKTEVRNKAFDKVLSIFPNFTLLAKTVEEENFDVLPAVEETIVVYKDDTFR